MLIDAHNHPNWHGFNAEKILKNMDEQNIDQLWLFSWEAPEDEYSPSYHNVLPPTGVCIPLEDVIQVGRTAPDRFVLGYMPHPKRPDAIDRLKAAVEIHGIRVASELKVRVVFDDPDALRLYHVCGDMGLPITIHLDYPIDHGRGITRDQTGGMAAASKHLNGRLSHVPKPTSSATPLDSGHTFPATANSTKKPIPQVPLNRAAKYPRCSKNTTTCTPTSPRDRD